MKNSPVEFTKVIEIIYEAGKRVKKYFGSAKALRYKTSSSSDIVTALDESTEKYIGSELQKLYPEIGFRGEEFGGKELSDRFWLLDPIDGTGFFARGVPGCTTMLSLIERGEVTASIIYDFVLDNMYHAQKGRGAFLNKIPLRVSNRDLKGAFLYVETHLNKKENLEVYLKLDKACEVLGNYPAGIHFAHTAAGRVEGRICLDPYGHDYDFAPGALLVQEAGGVVTNISTDSFDYRNLNILAVNKEVYRDLTTEKDPIFPLRRA